MPHRRPIHILEADPPTRRSLERLVASAGLAGVSYASAEEFLSACPMPPDGCAVLDVSLLGSKHPHVSQMLTAFGLAPGLLIIGLGETGSLSTPGPAEIAWVRKPFDPDEVLTPIRAAMGINPQPEHSKISQEWAKTQLATLSQRQREVLGLIVAGLANKQIAMRLGITERTVEHHRSQIMQNLGVDSVAQLVRISVTSGE